MVYGLDWRCFIRDQQIGAGRRCQPAFCCAMFSLNLCKLQKLNPSTSSSKVGRLCLTALGFLSSRANRGKSQGHVDLAGSHAAHGVPKGTDQRVRALNFRGWRYSVTTPYQHFLKLHFDGDEVRLNRDKKHDIWTKHRETRDRKDNIDHRSTQPTHSPRLGEEVALTLVRYGLQSRSEDVLQIATLDLVCNVSFE